MTNAEKYLKDEVDESKFREKLAQFIFSELGFYDGTEEAIDKVIGDFLDMIEKPQLTEDERVILRNIDKNNFIEIGRCEFSLYLKTQTGTEDCSINYMYHHLFQFIKERRRI